MFRVDHPLAMALFALLPAPFAYVGIMMVLLAHRIFFGVLGLVLIVAALGMSIKFTVEYWR